VLVACWATIVGSGGDTEGSPQPGV